MVAVEGAAEAVPDWLAGKIRRAAAWNALYAAFPVAVISSVLAGLVFVLLFEQPESKAAMSFWVLVFLVVLYLYGKDLWGFLRDSFRPERSDEAGYLRSFGSLAHSVSQIEAELQDSANLTGEAGVTFTRNWVIVSTRRRFAARPLDDLVWAYLKKTTTLLNFIPVWRSDSAVFRSSGPDAEAACSQEQGARFLERATGRCPWILLGHTEELEKLWEADRTTFIATVQERKRAL